MEFQQEHRTTSGCLALPEGGTGPGVIVLHAWWGLNDFFMALCERLAREGFVAFAPDLHGGAVADTIAEAEKLKEKIPDETVEERVQAAFATLQNHPAVTGQKIGALGCSMGAWWAVQLAIQHPDTVASAVLFYGVVGGVDFAASRCAYMT